MNTFRVAPMTPTGRMLTILVGAVPVISALRAWRAVPPARPVALAVAVVGGLVIAAVVLCLRPVAFELSEQGLRIRWMVRTCLIPWREVRAAQLFSGAEFRREQGRGARIGVGGLGGSFGLLTTDRETFSMWVTRFDNLVVVRLAGDRRPLLLTPERPAQFVEAVLLSLGDHGGGADVPTI